MKWTLVGLFLLLIISLAFAQEIVVPDCKADYDSFSIAWNDANSIDFDLNEEQTAILFEKSITCEASCGNHPVTYVNGIYYPELAIICNDHSNTFLPSLFDGKEHLEEIAKRDKNSAGYAVRTEKLNLIQSRFETQGNSALKLAKFEVCHGDYSCNYTFESKLEALNLSEVISARNNFRTAVNAYYFSGNKEKMIEAYLFFSKTRKAFQLEEMIERTKNVGNEVLLEMFSFIWSLILQIWWIFILAGLLTWHFRNAKSEKLESLANVFTDLQKLPYSFHPKDFLILIAAIWIGATIGFPILGDAHATNIQVLASENMDVIYEHVNAPVVDQLALFGAMQANLWLLLLLTLFTSILWVFAGLYGVKRAALVLGFFSVILFLGTIYFVFMGIGMGKPFLFALFGLIFLIIPFELLSLWWERHITKKDYIKSENGKIHRMNGCQSVEKIKNGKKVSISDQDLPRQNLCENCFSDELKK